MTGTAAPNAARSRPAMQIGPLRLGPYRVAAACAAALAADVAFDPAHRHVPLCPLHSATGLWCPLCGGLRAADALAHGQWLTALHDNALFVTAVPFLLGWWALWLLGTHTGRERRVRPRLLVPVGVGLAVAFTLVRNLPFAAALHPS